MNFVSHYYLDSLAGRPYHNFGLILPDLMSIFKRGWKLPESRLNAPDNSDQLVEIYSGFKKHLNLDIIFHDSELFVEYTDSIKALLNDEHVGLDFTRKHFLAHILLELLIDKIIILKDMQLLDRFYADLNKIEESLVREAVDGPQIDFHAFMLFFEKFRRRKFLYNYTHNEALIFVFNKIMERVGLQVIDLENDYNKIDKIIDSTEIKLVKNFSRIDSLRI